jgi:colicin import membrane protein
MTLWQTIKNKPSLLAWAIIIHAFVFFAIGVSFKASDPQTAEIKQVKVIEAVAIDEKKIQAEIDKLKKSEKRKKQEQKRLQDKAKKAKRDRKKEEQRLRALKKKQKEQAKRDKAKRLKEKKRLAEIERKQKETEEKLQRLEKERLAKQAQLEKEETERQQKIAEQKRQAEQKKRAAYEQSEVAKFKGMIRNQITRNWIFPASYQKGMKCKVLVRIIPGGDVISVKVIQSSGNIAFDNSVERAVYKAAPLPVPKADSGLFDQFREVEFVFDPNV